MRVRHTLIATFIGLVVAAGLSQSAVAVNWGTLVASYNNQTRATALGNFYNEGYQYATNYYNLNDPSNDGNNVYGHTDFYWYGQDSSCGSDTLGHPYTCWFGGSRISTGEWDYWNTPKVFYLRKNLQGTATMARGKTTVCVQLGWPVPDHCAASTYPTFSY